MTARRARWDGLELSLLYTERAPSGVPFPPHQEGPWIGAYRPHADAATIRADHSAGLSLIWTRGSSAECWHDLPDGCLLLVSGLARSEHRNVVAPLEDGLQFAERGASIAVQLGAALSGFWSAMRRAEREGRDLEDVANEMVVAFAVETDFFASVAGLRALRRLLGHSLSVLGLGERPRIAARPSSRMHSRIEPSTNLIRYSIAASAALIGGADMVAVPAFSLASPWAQRIAGTLPQVLALESHLSRPLDPASGSFYVDALTHELAEQGWTLFQRTEAQPERAREQFERECAVDAERRAQAVRTRALPRVGVSRFARADSPYDDLGGEDRERDSAPFESLRSTYTREAPGAVFWIMASSDCPRARIDFGREVAAVVGCEARVLALHETPPSNGVVLWACGEEMLEAPSAILTRVGELAGISRQAWLGARPDFAERLESAGIRAFIHAKADIVAELSRLLGQATAS